MFHVEQVERSSMIRADVSRGTFCVGRFADTVPAMWMSSPRPRKTFHVERSASDDFNSMGLGWIHRHCFTWNNSEIEIEVRCEKLRGWILAVTHEYKSPQRPRNWFRLVPIPTVNAGDTCCILSPNPKRHFLD